MTITIGPFTTVPAPGDPIRSPWAQQITTAVVALQQPDPAWTNVAAFFNGWVAFGAPYRSPRYRKIGDRVYVEGAIKTGTMQLIAFTLPVGYRPAAALQIACASNNLGGGMLILDNLGQVQPWAGTNASQIFTFEFSTI